MRATVAYDPDAHVPVITLIAETGDDALALRLLISPGNGFRLIGEVDQELLEGAFHFDPGTANA